MSLSLPVGAGLTSSRSTRLSVFTLWVYHYKRNAHRRIFPMVGLIGIEPMTSTMSTWRSNQLSYNPLAGFIIHIGAKKASTFFRFCQFDIETGCFLFVQAYFHICSDKPYIHIDAAPKLKESLEPMRMTQYENNIYSFRQKNHSKTRLMSAQAKKRFSRSRQKSLTGMRNRSPQSGIIPPNSGQASVILQQTNPPKSTAVNTSSQTIERWLLRRKYNGSNKAAG